MIELFGHPFSSYTQKVLVALAENAVPFSWRMIGPGGEANAAELRRLWPIGQFPVLLDNGRPVFESSIIIEYLERHHPGERPLIPADADAALETRLMDRAFDNHVMLPMQRVVNDALRPPERRRDFEVEAAKRALDQGYAWIESRMAGRTWAAGEQFSMADCAAAPALFYADWVLPIGEAYPGLRAYRGRLLDRPSYARCVEDARPYRPLFPLGAPDRD